MTELRARAIAAAWRALKHLDGARAHAIASGRVEEMETFNLSLAMAKAVVAGDRRLTPFFVSWLECLAEEWAAHAAGKPSPFEGVGRCG